MVTATSNCSTVAAAAASSSSSYTTTLHGFSLLHQIIPCFSISDDLNSFSQF
jgi:hypothetical protein